MALSRVGKNDASRDPKVRQTWQCPQCSNRYLAPIPVFEVQCHKTSQHEDRKTKQMDLVKGSALMERERSTVKKKGGRKK